MLQFILDHQLYYVVFAYRCTINNHFQTWNTSRRWKSPAAKWRLHGMVRRIVRNVTLHTDRGTLISNTERTELPFITDRRIWCFSTCMSHAKFHNFYTDIKIKKIQRDNITMRNKPIIKRLGRSYYVSHYDMTTLWSSLWIHRERDSEGLQVFAFYFIHSLAIEHRWY